MSTKAKVQTEEVKAKTLAAKLVEIRKSLGRVEKKGTNPHFHYKYVGLEQLNALLEPKLSEHNIFAGTSLVSNDVRYGEAKEGVFSSVITDHTYEDGETGEIKTYRSSGLGWDTGDKATAKAMTASLKSHLKACFMISDQADDPEADPKDPSLIEHAEKPVKKHNRFTEYEERTVDGDQKATTDLLELKAFLTEKKIPDAFLLRMLCEKELIDGHTKNVAGLKPGIIARCLSPKSKENLVTAYKQFVEDENSGSATAPGLGLEEPPDLKAPIKKEEVRTNEGDQRRNLRMPIDVGTDVQDYLEQEGIKDWREVKIHFGDQRGERLGDLTPKSLKWWMESWKPKQWRGRWDEKALLLDAALCVASQELAGGHE